VDATGRSKAGVREKREPDDDSGPRGRREACLVPAQLPAPEPVGPAAAIGLFFTEEWSWRR